MICIGDTIEVDIPVEELLDDVVSNVPNAQAFVRKAKEPAVIQQQQIIKPANAQRKHRVLRKTFHKGSQFLVLAAQIQ